MKEELLTGMKSIATDVGIETSRFLMKELRGESDWITSTLQAVNTGITNRLETIEQNIGTVVQSIGDTESYIRTAETRFQKLETTILAIFDTLTGLQKWINEIVDDVPVSRFFLPTALQLCLDFLERGMLNSWIFIFASSGARCDHTRTK